MTTTTKRTHVWMRSGLVTVRSSPTIYTRVHKGREEEEAQVEKVSSPLELAREQSQAGEGDAPGSWCSG